MDEKKLWVEVRRLIDTPTMLDRWGDKYKRVKRPANTLNACELYTNRRLETTEYEAFKFLNRQVDFGLMRIKSLSYVLTAKGLK